VASGWCAFTGGSRGTVDDTSRTSTTTPSSDGSSDSTFVSTVRVASGTTQAPVSSSHVLFVENTGALANTALAIDDLEAQIGARGVAMGASLRHARGN
jgi:hypothetical protein